MIKERLISCLLALSLLFALTPTVYAADSATFTEGNLIYRIIDADNKTVEIARVASVPDDGAIEIPATITHGDDVYTVSGISSIGYSDDVAMSIKSVKMPMNSDSFTYIGGAAFQGCTSITALTIPASVTQIGSISGSFGSFTDMTSLESVTFAENSKLETLGANAFAGCEKLRSLTLPNSLKNVGGTVVSGCTALSLLTIPSSVTEMDPRAFDGYYNNQNGTPNVSIENGGKYRLDSGILYADTSLLKAYEYPETLIIPEGITSIQDYAFASTDALNDKTTSLILPKSLNNIGKGAFMGCTALESVDFQGNTNLEAISDGAFTGCSSLKEIQIPNGVKSIGTESFYGCTGLQSIVLPEGLESIADLAFLMVAIEDGEPNMDKGNNNITSINIPSTVTSLGEMFLGGLKPDGGTTVVSQSKDPSIFTEDSLLGISGEGMNKPTFYFPADAKDAYTAESDNPLFDAGLVTKPESSDTSTDKGYDVTVSSSTTTLDESKTLSLAITHLIPNGAELFVESSDSNIATATLASDKTSVSITGVKEGNATITVGIKLGNIVLVSKTVTVTVNAETIVEPPALTRYNITVADSAGGTVDANASTAVSGKEITLTVTPGEGYHLDELAVTDRRGREIDVTDNGDGTYTFRMPASKVTITAIFAKDEAPAPEPTPELPFTDVAEGAWYYDAVQYVYGEGLMTGTSDTLFSPELTTTRGMIVSILHRLEGSPVVKGDSFDDVADGAWYAQAVAWAADNGIVNGYSDTAFGPNDPITREQLAAILYNYAEFKGMDTSARADLSSYTDSGSISSWAEDVMQWAVSEELISGVTNDTLVPQGQATRAQVAAILQRFLSK